MLSWLPIAAELELKVELDTEASRWFVRYFDHRFPLAPDSLFAHLQEAAANLFRMLRELDASDAKSIAVMPIPETGLGAAINDRLRRAAK